MKLVEVFQDILVEFRMGDSQLLKTAKVHANTVRIGYEFEFIVDGTRFGGGVERDTFAVSSMDFNEYDDYFDVSQRTRRQMDRDYNNWLQELDEDDPDGEEDWVEAEFDGIEGFVDYYDLEPTYGWDDDDSNSGYVYTEEGDSRIDDDAIRDNIEEEVKSQLSYLDRVDADSSIRTFSDEIGVEFVTEPMPFSRAQEVLKEYLDFIKNNGSTNSSTGLHVNLSFKDDRSIDWLKVGLFLGETHVLELFNRIHNMYTKPQINDLKMIIRAGNLPSNFDELIEIMSSAMSHDKYRIFNLGKYRDEGYIEFRAIGGDGYEDNDYDIWDTILRFVRVLAFGADKNAGRREYIKKVAKLFDDTFDEDFVDVSISGVDTFANKFLNEPKLTMDNIIRVLSKLFSRKVNIDSQRRILLRKFAKSNGITAENFTTLINDSLADYTQEFRDNLYDYGVKLLSLR